MTTFTTEDRVKSHILHLEEKHQVLDKKIDGLEKTGVFDDANIEDLKKQRLAIKDEIEHLKVKNGIK